jgi:hypothetical protein
MKATPTRHARLDPADRRELCRRADFAALLEADGIAVTRRGPQFVCKLRPDEKTASCYVYPPGVGKRGADGWTFKDFGGDAGGDALGYLVDVRGLAFADAVHELSRLANFTPAGWDDAGEAPPRPVPAASRLAPVEARTPEQAGMDDDEQGLAAVAFLAALDAADPAAVLNGDAYLVSRGVLPAGWPAGDAFFLSADTARKVACDLADGPDRDLCLRAGLLVETPGGDVRCHWWGPCVLLVCRDGRETRETWPMYLVARRLDWKPGGKRKYLNQICRGGASMWAFGWPSVYAAAGLVPRWPWKPTRRGCLIVEGPTDALGAWCLGWPAVALLTGPRVSGWEDTGGGHARMLEPHLAALREVGPVHVVPDADPGQKGIEGQTRAAGLVAWLRARGIRAAVVTVADLCPELAKDCKDVADMAKMQKEMFHGRKAPPPAVEIKLDNGQRPLTVRGSGDSGT